MKVTNITYLIGEKLLFDDVEINFKKNKINMIIGKNGVGKTTLLKIISELVKVKDVDFSDFPDQKNKIFITRDILVFNELKTIELIDFISTTHAVSKKKREKILNDCKMLNFDFYTTKIKNLSLGQSQKLLIAIALLTPVEIVLFDEPFNGLDVTSVKKLEYLLTKYKDEKTFILTSHLLENALSISDYINIISREGNIEELEYESFTKEAIYKKL